MNETTQANATAQTARGWRNGLATLVCPWPPDALVLACPAVLVLMRALSSC